LRPPRIWNRRQYHVAAVVRDFPLKRDNVGRPVREEIEPADLLRRLSYLETEIPGVGDRDAALSCDRKKIKRAETICPNGFGPAPFSPSSSRAWESLRLSSCVAAAVGLVGDGWGGAFPPIGPGFSLGP
jgi:hypothetical protein